MKSRKCKFKDRYWDFDLNSFLKYECSEPAIKDEFCVFHHPEYWRENEKRVREKFYEKVKASRRNGEKLLCRGYNLPSIEVTGEFEIPIYFSRTKFHGKASFRHAKFFKEVSFPHAEFSEEVDFSYANFFSIADFFRVEFSKKAKFDFAKFSERAFFTRLRRGSKNDPVLFFRNVEFDKPELIIFDEFNLTNTSFLYTDVSKISIGERVSWGSDRRVFDERMLDEEEHYATYNVVATVYHRLRQNLESRMRYAEAGRFFIGEMECKRKKVKVKNPFLWWIRVNIFSALAWYKYMSNYGESYHRVILWILTVPIFAGLLTTLIQISNPHQFASYLPQKLQNIILAFFQLRTNSTLDIALRLIGLLLLGQLYISLRRQFERRYRD